MRGLSVVAAVCCLLFGNALRAQQWGTRVDGGRPGELAPRGTRAVVLFFVATDCPISNRTFPEMRRLREEFSARGVRFWFVYPNAGEHAADVQQHQAAFDAGGDALLDSAGALVHLSRAMVTPEMAVLVPDTAHAWRPVYTGRVDNRYVRIGLERPAATEHFGEEVLTEVLANKLVMAPVGEPVGCAILRAGVR